MKTVKEILDDKGFSVYFVDPLASSEDALCLMIEKNVGALVVLIDEFLVGIISERDYVRKLVLDNAAAKLLKVSEMMTRKVISVKPDDDISTCITLMKQHHIRHLPVVRDGKVFGILSLRDLFLEFTEKGADD